MKSEQERESVLNDLWFSNASVLVATDVAVAALAAFQVRFVVNYDYPSSEDEYLRRLKYVVRPDGRGVMCTFLAPDETAHAKELILLLRKAGQNVPPQLRKVARR
ncbi:hypothetical protein MRX96_032787 [Rhipicephalus microplus]